MPHQHHNSKKRAVFSTPVPHAGPNYIIFPFDKPNKQFDTSDYSPSETKNRCQVEEIEHFLDDITVPYLEWYKKYGYLFDGSTGLSCLLAICFILIPLMFIFACWLSSAQNRAMKEHEKMVEKTRQLVKETQQNFLDKGLLWVVPSEFPLWIELWTRVEGPQPWTGGPELLGVKMMALSQESSQNITPSPRNKKSVAPSPRNADNDMTSPSSRAFKDAVTSPSSRINNTQDLLTPSLKVKKSQEMASTSPSIRIYNNA